MKGKENNMTEENKKILLEFINSALETLNNIKDAVENNKTVKSLDVLCIERDVVIIKNITMGE